MNLLTKQETLTLMYKQWIKIAEMTEKLKKKVNIREYFEFMDVPKEEIPTEYHYACEYGSQQSMLFPPCYNCPISVWRGTSAFHTSICYNNHCSPYSKWLNSTDWQESAKYAREIAKLAEEELEMIDEE